MVAIGLACRGLPSSCRRRKASPLFGKAGLLFLLAQRKVTKRKGPWITRLREQRAALQGGCLSVVGAHLCATSLRRGTSHLRGRAQVRSYKGTRWLVDGGSISPLSFFVGAHLVRDKPTERYAPAWLSRTGCAPTDKQARQPDGAMPKANA